MTLKIVKYMKANLKKLLFGLVASLLYLVFKVKNATQKNLFSKKLDFDSHKIKKILVICFGGIGDLLLTTPALKALRESFPWTYNTVLAWKDSHEVLKGNPNIDEIVVTNSILELDFREILQLVCELRKRNFDLVICFKSAFPFSVNREVALLSSLSGAPYQLGYGSGGSSKKQRINYESLYNIKLSLKDRQHAAERNLGLLHAIGINKKVSALQIQVSEENKEYSKAFMWQHGILGSDLIIGIHPGSGQQIWKRWEKEKFAELADKIIEKYAAKVIFFYGPNERELRDEISCLTKRKHIVAYNLYLKQTSAIIEKCDVFISGDTGLMHIAEAMQKPRVVAIFGPTNPSWSGPYGKEHIVIRKNLPCSPCYLDPLKPGQRIKCETFDCLKSISAQDALQKMDQLFHQMEQYGKFSKTNRARGNSVITTEDCLLSN